MPTASLQRGKTSSLSKCPEYDSKPSDGGASVLELWGIQNTPSLRLLSGPFWHRALIPVRVLSMGQLELFKGLSLISNWIISVKLQYLKWFNSA